MPDLDFTPPPALDVVRVADFLDERKASATARAALLAFVGIHDTLPAVELQQLFTRALHGRI